MRSPILFTLPLLIVLGFSSHALASKKCSDSLGSSEAQGKFRPQPFEPKPGTTAFEIAAVKEAVSEFRNTYQSGPVTPGSRVPQLVGQQITTSFTINGDTHVFVELKLVTNVLGMKEPYASSQFYRVSLSDMIPVAINDVKSAQESLVLEAAKTEAIRYIESRSWTAVPEVTGASIISLIDSPKRGTIYEVNVVGADFRNDPWSKKYTVSIPKAQEATYRGQATVRESIQYDLEVPVTIPRPPTTSIPTPPTSVLEKALEAVRKMYGSMMYIGGNSPTVEGGSLLHSFKVGNDAFVVAQVEVLEASIRVPIKIRKTKTFVVNVATGKIVAEAKDAAEGVQSLAKVLAVSAANLYIGERVWTAVPRVQGAENSGEIEVQRMGKKLYVVKVNAVDFRGDVSNFDYIVSIPLEGLSGNNLVEVTVEQAAKRTLAEIAGDTVIAPFGPVQGEAMIPEQPLMPLAPPEYMNYPKEVQDRAVEIAKGRGQNDFNGRFGVNIPEVTGGNFLEGFQLGKDIYGLVELDVKRTGPVAGLPRPTRYAVRLDSLTGKPEVLKVEEVYVNESKAILDAAKNEVQKVINMARWQITPQITTAEIRKTYDGQNGIYHLVRVKAKTASELKYYVIVRIPKTVIQ